MSGYYNVFPLKSMNVIVQPVAGDKQGKKRLVVTKDIKEGDTIYKVSTFLCTSPGSSCEHGRFRRNQSSSLWMPIFGGKVPTALIA